MQEMQRETTCENAAHAQEVQEHIRALIAKFESCPYCHSRMLFTHELNLEHLEVIENGRCSGCGMHTNPRKHSLQ